MNDPLAKTRALKRIAQTKTSILPLDLTPAHRAGGTFGLVSRRTIMTITIYASHFSEDVRRLDQWIEDERLTPEEAEAYINNRPTGFEFETFEQIVMRYFNPATGEYEYFTDE